MTKRKTKAPSLELAYLPLSTIPQWKENAKLHDIEALIAAFTLHGFHDPPKFDKSINDGTGGISAGNGRIEALQKMRSDGDAAPAGIAEVPEHNGVEFEWMVPVLVGLDLPTTGMAEAYAVDHNNLVLLGADVTGFYTAGLWNPEGYARILKRILLDHKTDLVSLEDDDAKTLAANIILDMQARNQRRQPLREMDDDGRLAHIPGNFGSYRFTIPKDRFFAWKDALMEEAGGDEGDAELIIWTRLGLTRHLPEEIEEHENERERNG